MLEVFTSSNHSLILDKLVAVLDMHSRLDHVTPSQMMGVAYVVNTDKEAAVSGGRAASAGVSEAPGWLFCRRHCTDHHLSHGGTYVGGTVDQNNVLTEILHMC